MRILGHRVAEDPLEYGHAVHDLGHLLYSQNRLVEAESVHAKGEQALIGAVGWAHRATLMVALGRAHLLHSMDKEEASGEQFRRAHREALAALGPDDYQTAECASGLAGFLDQVGAYAEAEPLRQTIVAYQRRAPGDGDSELANELGLLGITLLKLERYVDAEPVLLECLEIRERFAPEHWLRFNTMCSLGGALAGQGAALRESAPDRAAALFAEAEPLLVDGYAGMKDRAEALPLRKREALERIVALYDAWGKPERAAAHRAMLESLNREP
jgi:tetratricopeptide (TPR) repeat protein